MKGGTVANLKGVGGMQGGAVGVVGGKRCLLPLSRKPGTKTVIGLISADVTLEESQGLALGHTAAV